MSQPAYETDEALHLIQTQNRALRDRLRSAASENERLHEELRRVQAAQPPDDPVSPPLQAAQLQTPRGAAVGDAAAAEAAELRGRLAAAEQERNAAQQAEQQAVAQSGALSSALAATRRAQARLQAELAAALECADGLRADNSQLRAQLARLEELISHQEAQGADAIAEAEALRQVVAALEGRVSVQQAAAPAEAVPSPAQAEALQRVEEELSRVVAALQGAAADRDRLAEKCAALKEQLGHVRAERAAAKEAAAEEAGWLRQGAEELQRQLEVARVEAEAAAAAQHADGLWKQRALEAAAALDAAHAAAEQQTAEMQGQLTAALAELTASKQPLLVDAAGAAAAVCRTAPDVASPESKEPRAPPGAVEDGGDPPNGVSTAEDAPWLPGSGGTAGGAPSGSPADPGGAQRQPHSADVSPFSMAAQTARSSGPSVMLPLHQRDASFSSEIEPAGGTPGASAGAAAAVPPKPPATPPPHDPAALAARVAALEHEIVDSERTHALRDRASAVLKEEVAELRRQQKREAVDLEYVKAVLVESFASGELDGGSRMLPVLARLLHFSPADLERAAQGRAGAAPAAVASLASAASALLSRLGGAGGG
jgi:hypothetical protein